MSTDLLRRAASKLREYAAAATHGPWESLDRGDRLVAWKLNPEGQRDDDFDYVVDEPISNAANAEYIALMHPPVALALAELLHVMSWMPSFADPTDMHIAVVAARAVLREEEATNA
jgi:hypothetical protein